MSKCILKDYYITKCWMKDNKKEECKNCKPLNENEKFKIWGYKMKDRQGY